VGIRILLCTGVLVFAAMAPIGCRLEPAWRAGFWYEDSLYRLPAGRAERLGGPLTDEELQAIKRISLAEVENAFAGFRVGITSDPDAFWKVRVAQSLPKRMNQARPRVGESLALGMLGGIGTVGFDNVASSAMQFAPPGASRGLIVDGIGRGIGRVAVHELFHQMLGFDSAHNDADPDSYEYGSPDRSSQYYGALRWTTALPPLQKKLGRSR
jgi:hypothetical protein